MLTDEDRTILQDIIDVWADEGELRLSGSVSYQQAFDCIQKLGLAPPDLLMEIMDGRFEAKMRNRNLRFNEE